MLICNRSRFSLSAVMFQTLLELGHFLYADVFLCVVIPNKALITSFWYMYVFLFVVGDVYTNSVVL